MKIKDWMPKNRYAKFLICIISMTIAWSLVAIMITTIDVIWKGEVIDRTYFVYRIDSLSIDETYRFLEFLKNNKAANDIFYGDLEKRKDLPYQLDKARYLIIASMNELQRKGIQDIGIGKDVHWTCYRNMKKFRKGITRYLAKQKKTI